jgi:DNA-binding NarL/FixJ family response regulator
MLLEDQALIAIDIEEMLNAAGFEAINTFSSCSAAAEWLEKHTPELAVIETRLTDGYSDEIADTLTARGVPYIVHSGEDESANERLKMQRRSMWISKPCDPEKFLEAVRHAVTSRRITASR